MARRKLNLRPKAPGEADVHTHVDPVTHAVVREVRDAVWRAVRDAAGAVEAVGREAPTDGFIGPWAEAVRGTRALLAALEAGRLDPAGWRVLAQPYRAVACIYGRLGPSEQPAFTARMWERLRLMERHRESDPNQTEAA